MSARQISRDEQIPTSMEKWLTINPTEMRRYFQPWFPVSTLQGGLPGAFGEQEYGGMTIMPTTADKTDPKEKNTDNAVTRYFLP